jgi:hypothetical protein
MAHLGALLLTAVLSILPRIFRRAVLNVRIHLPYFEVAPGDPALLDFTTQLAQTIDRYSRALAEQPTDDTLVVEVHRLTRLRSLHGTKEEEAVSVTFRGESSFRPLILHYSPEQRARAVQTLVGRLSSRSLTAN